MRSRRGAGSMGVACLATACAFAAHAAFVAACAQFSAVADVGDASPFESDAASADGAVGMAPDAASGEGGEGGEGGPLMPDAGCAHDFCADFEGPLPATGWNAIQVGPGGALAIVGGAGAQGKALSSSIPATASNTADWAYVVEQFPNAGGAHVELDVNAPEAALGGGTVLHLLQLSGQAATNESGVGVTLREPNGGTGVRLGFFIAHGDATNNESPYADIDMPRGVWVHLALDLRFGSTGGYVKLMVGNQVAWNKPLASAKPATPELRIGVQHYNGTTPQFAALYDNVRVDLLK